MELDDVSIQFIVINMCLKGPLYLVWFAGIIYAVVRFRQHPTVSTLVIIPLAIMSVMALLTAFIDVFLPVWLIRIAGINAVDASAVLVVRGFIEYLIIALLWAMVLVALFGWRSRRPAPPPAGGADTEVIAPSG